ncbi:hypothetical protein B0T17DRAFT_511150 [Bombardia bombarda]|uniref:Uncharacterized protein n=1 Tax=Bombardia bombarda TaxID=252184 RepID=A0AA39TPX6_9PEZI|nr:hypothetical protein B0T17DRAFT_511150 [Bombardia bombarda]
MANFNDPVPFIEDPLEQGTNRTYLGNPIFQVEASGFTSTVTEQYVLHGYLTKEGKEPASLVVVHFSLHRDSSVRSRRFRKVTISLTFSSASRQPSDDPAIRCFSPAQDGDIGVIPTAVLRRKQNNREVSAKVEVAPAPVNLGFLYGWKDEAEWEQHLVATVSAKVEPSSRTRDRVGYNVVTWTMTENHRQKKMPGSYQLAVILERKNDEPFIVKAKVDASVDLLHALADAPKSLIGLKQPVKTYDPAKRAEWGKLEYPEQAEIDGDALGLLVNGRELDRFAYVHVVEQVTPLSLYGGKQPAEPEGPQELGGGQNQDNQRQDDSGGDAKTSLSLSLQFGTGAGKDGDNGGDDDDQDSADDDFQDAQEF